MSKETLLFGIVELIVLLIPVITMISKFGAWRKEVDMKIAALQKNDDRQDTCYNNILSQLNSIQVLLGKFEERFKFIERSAAKDAEGESHGSR